MLKKTGGGDKAKVTNDQANTQNQSETNLSADLSFKTLSDFKTSKGGDCVKKNLSETIDLDTLGTALSGSAKIESSYFSSNDAPNSCLVVNWERTGSSNSSDANAKWKGEFRWLWTFVKGDKGMIVFTSYKPHSDASKVSVEGGIYFLKKETAPEKWKIEKHKEIKTSDTNAKTLDSTSFDASFPEKGDLITDLTKDTNKNKWGFTSGQEELSKLCKSGENDCPASAAAEKIFKGSWKWTPVTGAGGESDKTIDQWGKSVITTITTLYGSDGLQLTNAFSSIKGTWTKQNLQEPQ